MNPTEDPAHEVYCEWPVASRWFGEPARSCGRGAFGRHVRLCWQHREAANAEVINSLYEYPDGKLSEHLANWVRSTEPRDTDDPETAQERAKSAKFVSLMLVRLMEYGGIDRIPSHVAHLLDPLVDREIERRMAETWGAA